MSEFNLYLLLALLLPLPGVAFGLLRLLQAERLAKGIEARQKEAGPSTKDEKAAEPEPEERKPTEHLLPSQRLEAEQKSSKASPAAQAQPTPSALLFGMVMATPLIFGLLVVMMGGQLNVEDPQAGELLGLAAALAVGLGGLGATLGMGLAVRPLRLHLAQDKRLFGRVLILFILPESILIFGLLGALQIIFVYPSPETTLAAADTVLQGALLFGVLALVSGLAEGGLLVKLLPPPPTQEDALYSRRVQEPGASGLLAPAKLSQEDFGRLVMVMVMGEVPVVMGLLLLLLSLFVWV